MGVIKAIIFDCFGVLYIPIGEDFYRSHIAHYDDYRDELHDLGKQADYGLISQDEFVHAVAALTKLDVDAVREGVVSGLVRNQVLLEYTQTLRQHYKVSMLSNISAQTMDQFFTQAERQQFFDDVVISSEIGLVKPHPAIFELAAQRLGVDTSQAVMVDDSPINCTGAIEVGMRAIVYKSFESLKQKLEPLLGGSVQ